MTNTTIRLLNLSGNFIGAGGGRTLCEVIRRNTGLRELDISYNSIPVDAVTAIKDEVVAQRRQRHVDSRTRVFQGISLLHTNQNPWMCSAAALREKRAKLDRNKKNDKQRVNGGGTTSEAPPTSQPPVHLTGLASTDTSNAAQQPRRTSKQSPKKKWEIAIFLD